MGCVESKIEQNKIVSNFAGKECQKEEKENTYLKINCKICYFDYDHYSRCPMVLDCYHTICLYCLNQLTKKECPFDHLSITRYGKNYQLLPLIEQGNRPEINPLVQVSQAPVDHQHLLERVVIINMAVDQIRVQLVESYQILSQYLRQLRLERIVQQQAIDQQVERPQESQTGEQEVQVQHQQNAILSGSLINQQERLPQMQQAILQAGLERSQQSIQSYYQSSPRVYTQEQQHQSVPQAGVQNIEINVLEISNTQCSEESEIIIVPDMFEPTINRITSSFRLGTNLNSPNESFQSID